MGKVTPFLWFDHQAEEAVNYYLKVFKNSKLGNVVRYDAAAAKAAGRPEGSVLTISFQLGGTDFTALNGGPIFKFTEAISFVVTCDDQAEIDHYWNALSAVPEAEQCGWCKDKFGISWQIVPRGLDGMISRPAGMKAMLGMKKLVIADLKNAK